MHGIDVLNALRSDPQTADTPIVVVSADANPRQIQRLRAAGAQDYMTKPLKVSEVFRLLDMHGRPETPPA
jgi:CheY-like chemotaxis protein